MTRIVCLLPAAFALCLTLVATAPAQAQNADDQCFELRGKAKIEACTREINSGRFSGFELSRRHVNRGIGYESLEDFDRAFADYDAATRADASNAYAYANRGDMYLKKGESTRAFADFKRAIDLEPNNPDNHNVRCWALTRSNIDLRQALSDCSRAIDIKRNDPLFWGNRGFTNFRLGNFDNAISDFNEALRMRPRLTDSLYLRGLSTLKKGDSSGNADVAAAKEIDPSIEEEYIGYGVRR